MMPLRSLLIFLLVMVLSMMSLCEVFAQEENLVVGGVTRKMIVYAPTGLTADRPLMISLHGMDQDPAFQQGQSKWEQVADTANFVVVYPRGINLRWDISGNSDVNFILAIIDEMHTRYGVDRNRVYLSGFSMGGMMTYFAATKIADKIAAFAPVSGYLMGGPNTNSSRPIPIIHVHGTADDVVVYNGVQPCIDAWVLRNNCPTTSVVTPRYPVSNVNSQASKSVWSPGLNGVEIQLLTLGGKGHWWSLDLYAGVHTSAEIWKFCRRFSLDPGKPSVSFVSPANNSEFTTLQSILVSAAASDVDGTIKDVSFYEGETLLHQAAEAPYSFSLGNLALGTHVLRVKATDSDGKSDEALLKFTVVPPKTPILTGAQPEMNSFELPLTTRNYHFTYDEEVDCSKVKAQLIGATGTVDLELSQTGFSKSLSFALPTDVALVDGEHRIVISDIYSQENVPANRNDVVLYSFGSLGEGVMPTTVLAQNWLVENTIPMGWKLTYGTNVRDQGSTHSSGPRMLKFLAGGDFDYGMYLRDEGAISRFSYGLYEQSRLVLEPAIHTVNFYYSWWTAGTAQRNQKIQFAVLDLSGKVVFEQRDITTNHGFNENRQVVVTGSKLCEISFVISEEQPYVLQWRTEQFGYDGAILGGVRLVSFESVAAIATKYKNLLSQAMQNAQQMATSVVDDKYNGTAKDNLLQSINTYGSAQMTAPSEYVAAVDELNANIEAMRIYKASLPTSLNLLGLDQGEVMELQYFNLQGVQVEKPDNGLFVVRVVYRNGQVLIKKVLF